MKLSYVHLYSTSLTTSFLSKKVAIDLHEILPFIEVDVRPFTYQIKNNRSDYGYDNLMELSNDNCTDGENIIHHELQNSSNNRNQKITIIDGFYLQRISTGVIAENESQMNHFHLVFEDNLVCTYDENDKRYHARPIICGSPSIIQFQVLSKVPPNQKDTISNKC